MALTLAQLKTREAAWRKSYDALTDESDNTPGDVTEQHSARFDELYEEAEAIEADYARLRGAEAGKAAMAFAFLFRNVRQMNQPPKHVIAICQALAA